MKILVVSSYLPYPLFNGGNIRLYNLLKYLAKEHEITLICERRENQTDADVRALEAFCKKVLTVPRRKQWSAENIFKTGTSSSPFLITGHTSQEMTDLIEEELRATKYDLIHVETFYVMQNLPATDLPIVLAEHNIEYLVYQRYAYKAPFFLRPLLMVDVRKLRRLEEVYWKKASAVIAVSEAEKAMIETVTQKSCFLVPNGVDTSTFKPLPERQEAKENGKMLLFIGDYKWMQNRDAVTWIIKTIWPKINEKLKTENVTFAVKLWIVGRTIPDSLKALTSDPNIVFDENAPDNTAEIFNQADLLLAPIRVGGGTSYKILESMAVGTPVVTTSLGQEGIEVVKGRDLLVADSPEEIAKVTVEVLSNPKEYKRLSENGRKQVAKTYDWPVIAKALEKVYRAAVSK
jgi:glycosyltransferase involved in cell wall biosynthesis